MKSGNTGRPLAFLPSTIVVPKSKEAAIDLISIDSLDIDKEWLNAVRTWDEDSSEDLSCVAYQAKKSANQNVSADLSVLLPMWRKTSKSPAMLKHTPMVVVKVVEFLNPGQVLVAVCNCKVQCFVFGFSTSNEA